MCKRSPREVFLGNLPGGAAESTQIHDRLDTEGDSTGEGESHSHAVQAEPDGERPIRGDSVLRAESYLKLLAGL